MKKYGRLCAFLFIAVCGALLAACPDVLTESEEEKKPPEEPADTAVWFKDMYDELCQRVGDVTSEDYSGPVGNTGGQIATRASVCAEINARRETNFLRPEAGTEDQAADCAYLLTMIDKANTGRTLYAASRYATAQVVDVDAVNQAAEYLWGAPKGRFVAVGEEAASSADGVVWTAGKLPAEENQSYLWEDVTYGKGKFVAVGSNGFPRGLGITASSSDGINWTRGTIPDGVWMSVAYGNNKFVALSSLNEGAVAYSADGITWTPGKIPAGNWFSVTYGEGKFVAVSIGKNLAAYSADGINWSLGTIPAGYWYSAAYCGGMFIAGGFDGEGRAGWIAYSTNGTRWTQGSIPPGQWEGIAYGNGMFVAVGYDGTFGNYSGAAYSADGINWSAGTIPAGTTGYGSWYSAAYANGKFVAVGTDGRKASSPDGINWTVEKISSGHWKDITYGGG